MGVWTKLFGGAEEESTRRKNGKTVTTPHVLGVGLAQPTFEAGKRLFQEFKDMGVMAQLSNHEQAILGFELMLFELMCKSLALNRFYREAGHKASLVLADGILTALATGWQAEDVPKFVTASFVRLDAHRQHYAQDIWDLWNTTDEGDFSRKIGPTGIGEKLLRIILNPVIGISLKESFISRQACKDYEEFKRLCEEAEKEWKKVPNSVQAATHCSMHAALQLAPMKLIHDEFDLS